MKFGFLEPFIVLLNKRQSLVESCVRFGEPTCLRAPLSQDAQVLRNRQFCARASVGFQALLQLSKSTLFLALQQQAASGVQRTGCAPEIEPLLRGDANLLVPGRMCLDPKPAMLIKPARMMQRVFEAEGVVDCACELHHLAVELQRPVRETKMPQGQRQITAMRDAGILAHEPCPERRARAIV